MSKRFLVDFALFLSATLHGVVGKIGFDSNERYFIQRYLQSAKRMHQLIRHSLFSEACKRLSLPHA